MESTTRPNKKTSLIAIWRRFCRVVTGFAIEFHRNGALCGLAG